MSPKVSNRSAVASITAPLAALYAQLIVRLRYHGMKTLFSFISALLITCCGLFAADGWTDDYENALTQAKLQKKLVLLRFTGSDWCVVCKRQDKEAFSRQDFQDYAKGHLVLVNADFPTTNKLPKKLAEQNEKLKTKFDVIGWPVVLLLNAEGKELERWVGYQDLFLRDLKAKADKHGIL